MKKKVEIRDLEVWSTFPPGKGGKCSSLLPLLFPFPFNFTFQNRKSILRREILVWTGISWRSYVGRDWSGQKYKSFLICCLPNSSWHLFSAIGNLLPHSQRARGSLLGNFSDTSTIHLSLAKYTPIPSYLHLVQPGPGGIHKAMPSNRISPSPIVPSPKFPILLTSGINTFSCFIWSWLSGLMKKWDRAYLHLKRSLLTKMLLLEMRYDLLGFKLLHVDFVPSSNQDWKVTWITYLTQLNTGVALC